MHEPLLKLHWERINAHVDLDIDTAATLLAPYTKAAIADLTLLSEGCANTNYKASFSDNTPPVVIRIYVRDSSALQRDVRIHKLIAEQVPVADYLYADSQCTIYPYPYAVLQWIEGKLLREIIFTQDEQAISDCVFAAGKYLSVLRTIKLPHAGFFNAELQVQPFTKEQGFLAYMTTLLQDANVRQSLGNELSAAVYTLINENADLLPSQETANLVHGDYDPANMLVKEVCGKWKIAAILDWEFALAATYFFDIGTMLRYSHRLPSYYEQKFIAGIEARGELLPTTWKKQAKLMDMLCLLQLIQSSSTEERPKMHQDLMGLIAYTVEHWM